MMRDFKKSTNSLETRRIRKILNEETRLGISPNSESETEEVDLQKELYPLGHYINNREEMIEQMFSIIKGAKLKKMLPPILKDMPFDELKADCLIHLLGMSKKRIKSILEGREINFSSDSESHSDSSTTGNKKPEVELKPFVIKQEGCSDISDNSEEVVLVDPDLDFLNLASNDSTKVDAPEEKKKPKRKLKKKDLDKKHKRMKTKVVEEASESDEVQQIDSSAESASENEMETQAPKEGKTLLEILELEMRARAIRALLKNNDPQEGEEPQKTVEDLTLSPANSKEKSIKLLKEDTTTKITPAKNFRKKKRKNDDVIVIAPKVVTIDLTDENEHSSVNNNKKRNREENVSSQNNTLNDNSGEVLLKDPFQTNIEGDQSYVSDQTTVVSVKFSRAKDQVISEKGASCSDEASSKRDSVNKTAQPEHDKTSWAQRWLESKEVKKVVSTSKICGNIRKKIKSARLAKKKIPIQDEPDKSSPAPQKEIEGSVVEYELLSKSTAMTLSDAAGVDNDTQASILSSNQEPTSSEADLTETSTADQVQDVSSTRAENLSAGLVQDTVSGIQVNEEEPFNTNIKPGESEISDVVTAELNLSDGMLITSINYEDADEPTTADEEVERSDLKCFNKNDDNLENENICSTIQIDQILPDNDSKNTVENEKLEEHLIFPKENTLDSSFGKLNVEALNKKSNDADECSGLLPNNVNNIQDSEAESQSLLTDEGVTNSSKTSDGNDTENECDSNNKSDPLPNQEDKNTLKSEPKSFEQLKTETSKSKLCATLKNVISPCSAKPPQELNEPETLEINITDEDRDIEDLIEENEQNQSENVKDSIIVID